MEINKNSGSSNEQEPKSSTNFYSKHLASSLTSSPSSSTSPPTSVATSIKSPDQIVQREKQKKFQLQKNKDSSSSNGSVDSNSIAKCEENPATKFKYSRTHQKRFHRRFPTIEADEQLIDWFACALLADILLQGYLYISPNYFAFYSNIFGYKTHILIPIEEVTTVTKEKTAKIFPNAVGIATKTHRYVFGSLFSRENTHRLLQEVWQIKLNTTKAAEDEEEEMVDVDKRRFTSVLNANVQFDDSNANDVTELKSMKSTADHYSDSINHHSFSLQNKSNSLGNPVLSSSFARFKSSSSAFDSKLRQRHLHRSETDCLSKDTNSLFSAKRQLLDSSNQSYKFTMKRFMSSSSAMFLIVALVILLFTSSTFLLIKINHAHSKILEITPNRTNSDRRGLFGEQLNQMVSMLKTNLNEIDQIKSTIEKLLQSVPSL